MKKYTYLIIILVFVIGGIWYFSRGGNSIVPTALKAQAEQLCGGANVVRVEANATVIKVTSSLPGGGSSFVHPDGTKFNCPIVGPDSQTQECKDADTTNNWETICSK